MGLDCTHEPSRKPPAMQPLRAGPCRLHVDPAVSWKIPWWRTHMAAATSRLLPTCLRSGCLDAPLNRSSAWVADSGSLACGGPGPGLVGGRMIRACCCCLPPAPRCQPAGIHAKAAQAQATKKISVKRCASAPVSHPGQPGRPAVLPTPTHPCPHTRHAPPPPTCPAHAPAMLLLMRPSAPGTQRASCSCCSSACLSCWQRLEAVVIAVLASRVPCWYCCAAAAEAAAEAAARRA